MASSPSPTDQLITVAVPVPGLGVLSYRVPPHLPRAPKGARVNVPLGTRVVTGVVIDADASAPAGATLRDVAAVLDTEPFLPEIVADLALWVGEYYASGPGDALTVALPVAARRGDAPSFRRITRVALVPDRPEDVVLRGAQQRELIARLHASPGGLTMVEILEGGRVGRSTIQTLAARGLVRLTDEIALRDPFAGTAGRKSAWSFSAASSDARELNDEQTAAMTALDALAETGQFHTALVHGVTGSGKTEVYLHLARRVLDRGRRVLVLVPEIALTPALVGVFRARFGTRVAIQHSALSDGERHDQWHQIRRGLVDLVVGTRSAVFAPLEQLGLIVVDEEHEPSYKQEESPRYHGRDVAVMRGQMARALVVLGSATPSLESAVNADAGRYQRITLTKRVLDRPLATVDIIDMRPEFAAHGPDTVLSGRLVAAIDMRLSRGEQSLILLNRRGFASVIFCRQCGASVECPHCSVALTFHRAARRLRCHYCNYAATVPTACGACAGQYLEQSGFGTERIQAEVAARFPGARVVRVDRDTVRRRGAITRVLESVAAGDVDVIVGTQMIAKGHDFPAVTLVGVVSADVGLGRADFRAAERTFQLLTQVVGRAGRGDVAGEALVQTLYPDHYAVRAAAAQDYATFFAREMEFRRALRYPPAVGLINVVVKGRTLDAAMKDAADLVSLIRQRGVGQAVVGPAPAAMSKIKDEYRVQFFLKGASRRALRFALTSSLDTRPDLKRRVIVDVDPMSVG